MHLSFLLIIEIEISMLFFFFREGNDPTDDGKITFSELKDKVCQFANVLKSLGKY